MLCALSSILRTALRLNQLDNLLFVTSAKLARRFCKRPDTSREECFATDIADSAETLVSNKSEGD